ncbi:MAG TPA: heavy metal-associated domain-containing protein, partial [Candidatus Saccharimonadia bacterium]|nr:heavy metal-associated domain-containing protein [Candidatus Saccharimonadia bacterium]
MTTPLAPQTIEMVLPIEGMTCASCVNRIERFLTRTDGVVEASVNLATERAHVVLPAELTPADAIRAVEASGYSARVHEPESQQAGEEPAGGDRALTTRFAVAAALALPVVLLTMVPGLH